MSDRNNIAVFTGSHQTHGDRAGQARATVVHDPTTTRAVLRR